VTRNGLEYLLVTIASAGGIATGFEVSRFLPVAESAGIGLASGVAYWELLRGFTYSVLGYRYRFQRLKAAGVTRSVRSPKNAYEGLRRRALSAAPKELGLDASSPAINPYGVIMETGYEKGIATLACFATGDASLYFSTGGGIIGGAGHESVRNSSKSFVSAAATYLSRLERVGEFPLPARGRTRFYVLTTNGVLTDDLDEQDLGHNRIELSSLFHAGHQVIYDLRTAKNK
jgi:hypothetical protein